MAVVVGVDPGMSGAVAVIRDGDILDVADMPVADGRIAVPVLAEMIGRHGPDLVAIEFVHSMPKQGVASTFKFGVAYGVAVGVSHRFPTVHVRPQDWKKSFRLTGKGKDAARALVIERWPDRGELFALKGRGQGRADAVLIGVHASLTDPLVANQQPMV